MYCKHFMRYWTVLYWTGLGVSELVDGMMNLASHAGRGEGGDDPGDVGVLRQFYPVSC